MSEKEKSEFLENYYYNISNPATFTTPEKLYQVLKSNKNFKFSKYYISKWLRKQDAYTLQKEVHRPKKVPNIRVSGINVQWSMDLMDVQNLSKENDGIKFLLILIDTLSKYLRIVALKQKSARDVSNAIKLIFESGVKCQTLRSDRGGEFKNNLLQNYLKGEGVRLIFANQNSKASIAERVIRTIRGRFYRYFQRNRTYRYVDVLTDIVRNYNSTPHRSLNGLAPKEVTKENEADVWANLYLKNIKTRGKEKQVERKKKQRRIKYRYKVNDLVRLSHLKHIFRRGYNQQFTGEVFKIAKRFHLQGIPMYKVKDFNEELIEGDFYENELQIVEKDEETLWIVEKIIKKRTKKGKTEFLVKFESWPEKFNQWVRESDVVNIK
ncbi:uncharacterized protein LOC134233207 [Saccostrea cucullata]|uniref:uncharacterized protein LOC134233207 n=1 Tax=Saccostrea cuccullata TaxID=36930 RepID=UPI002ED570A8